MAATLKVDTIQNASSTTANITLDTAGNATVGNTLAMGSSFLRNRIINGDMRIDQRNAGASVTPAASSYLVDRWRIGISNLGSKLSFQQSSNAPTDFANSLLVTVASASSVAAGDILSLSQSIEGYNTSDLNWGTSAAKAVTLSFWVRSSLTGTFGGSFASLGATSSYNPFTYTINSANTWEYKTITVTGPTSNPAYTDQRAGLQVFWSLGVGSTFTGTPGTWTTTQFRNATGTVNLVETNGATFYITGVQLEVGSVATPFERRQYGQELALCQRYYETNYATGVVPGTAVTINPDSLQYAHPSGNFGQSTAFMARKRSAPTMVFYDVAGNSNKVTYFNGSWNNNGTISASGYSQASFYVQSNITSTVQTAFMFTASAEL